MKKLPSLIVTAIILTLPLIHSCSNMVDRINSDLDKQVSEESKKPSFNTLDQFRSGRGRKSPKEKAISTSSVKNLEPKIKREYKSVNENKIHRKVASDMNDQDNDNSIWIGPGLDSYLFSKSTEKQLGDIISVKVEKNLQDEINEELARAFPMPKKRGKNVAASPANPTAGKEPGSEENKNRNTDLISSVIIEDINKSHVLIRGRKVVFYNKIKRLIELQALVARKNINDDDLVQSDKILESSVYILR